MSTPPPPPEQKFSDDLPLIPPFGVLASIHLFQAYTIVAKLGIPDMLYECPQTAEELAKRTKTHTRSLYRILRALAAFNVFEENEKGEFELASYGKPLRSNVMGSLRDWAIHISANEFWSAEGRAFDVVKTGTDGARLAFGKGAYELLNEPGNEALRESVARAMSTWTNWHCWKVVKAYSFQGIKKMVDVAGGQGKLLTAILRKNQDMYGVLFDQSFNGEIAKKGFAEAGVADRCEFVGGNMFESVPAGADGYTIKHVLRDWSDEESIQVLRNIKNAMLPDSTLFLLEGVIDPHNGVDRLKKLIDIEQMFLLTGGLRTQAEWDSLLDVAGLKRIQAPIKTDVVDLEIMICKRK